jgi:hypothetical protein
MLDDDGSGKGKILDQRQKAKVLTAVFALGVLIGLVAAERLYIATNREDILAGVSSMGGTTRGSSSSSGGPAPSRGGRSSGAASGAAGAAAAAAASSDGNPAATAAEAAAVEAAAKDPELLQLRAYLDKIAPEGEVLIGVSNQTPMIEGMLDTWLEGVKQAGVSGGWVG